MVGDFCVQIHSFSSQTFFFVWKVIILDWNASGFDYITFDCKKISLKTFKAHFAFRIFLLQNVLHSTWRQKSLSLSSGECPHSLPVGVEVGISLWLYLFTRFCQTIFLKPHFSSFQFPENVLISEIGEKWAKPELNIEETKYK